MGLGYCSKVVSTVYGSPDLPSCRWHQKALGHPDFVVNLSSRACGACRRALRVHALELGKATAAQRDVSGSSAGGISDPHDGRGAGGASTSRAIPHDVLICNSPRPRRQPSLVACQQQRAPGGLAVQNAALSRKLKLKQPKRCVLSLFNFPSLWTCSPTPFFQLRTFKSIRQHGWRRNRKECVRGERACVAPNQ